MLFWHALCVHVEDDDDDSDDDDDDEDNNVVDDDDAACVNRSIAFYRAMIITEFFQSNLEQKGRGIN